MEEEVNIGHLFQFGDLFVSSDGKIRQPEEMEEFDKLFSEAKKLARKKGCKTINEFFEILETMEWILQSEPSQESPIADEPSQESPIAGVIKADKKRDRSVAKVVITRCENDDATGTKNSEIWSTNGAFALFDALSGRETCLSPRVSLDIKCYINLLKRQCSFSAILDDIRDALIYNLKYTKRKKVFTDTDIRLRGYGDRYSAAAEEDRTKFFMSFCREDMEYDFCNYSMSALLLQDAHNNNVSETGIRCFKFVKNPDDFKGRTFRNMLFSLGLDTSKWGFNEIEPQIEDRWFLEKVTGFRTAVALFPIVKDSPQWGKDVRVFFRGLVPTIMKCKPLKVRICLANITERAIHDSVVRASQGEYDLKKNLDEFETQLKEAVNRINGKYLFLLPRLYQMTRRWKGCRKNLRDEKIRYDNFFPFLKSKKYDNYSLRQENALWAIYFPETMDDALSTFSIPDSPKKRLWSENLAMKFQGLQSKVMRIALESYGLKLSKSRQPK